MKAEQNERRKGGEEKEGDNVQLEGEATETGHEKKRKETRIEKEEGREGGREGGSGKEALF